MLVRTCLFAQSILVSLKCREVCGRLLGVTAAKHPGHVADAPVMGGSEVRELFAPGFPMSYQPEFT